MIDSFRSAREAIQADAAEWILRLDEGTLPMAARSELLKWLKESPQHVEEFLFASAAWRELDDVDAGHTFDVEALIAEAADNVVPLVDVQPGEENTTPAYGRQAWWFSGIAATVLIAVTAALIWPSAQSIQYYETDLGQQTLFTLADGSIVHLNTQSELTVRMQSDSRVLHLRRGEAMFNVAKDPARPFRVLSGDVTVEAIGTQFNVYRREDGVHVTVVEGTVKVEPALPAAQPEQTRAAVTLTAGEEARSHRTGELARIDTPDLEKRTAWREQRLVFRGDSLSAVAAEFNRYNALQIAVDLPPSAARPVTATFDAHDPESFLSFLERDPMLQVTRANGRVFVRAAAPR